MHSMKLSTDDAQHPTNPHKHWHSLSAVMDSEENTHTLK